MNVIIIEDERPSARLLERKLNSLGIKVNVKLHSVEESIEWFLNNSEPDLIFLDIQLSDGLSFEIFETVNISTPVIFTTAYDEYAIQAFKLNSIDYLLKPINEEDLNFAITKFKTTTNLTGNNSINIDEIKRLLVSSEEKNYKTRFSAKVGTSIKLFNVSDISCFYSRDKTTYLYTTTGRNYILETSLDSISNQLNPEYFFKVNRKYIININEIKDISNYSNSRLKVNLNVVVEDHIIVARERVKEFRAWLN